MMDHTDEKSQTKVQFSEEIDKAGHDADIQVQVLNQFLVKVHLGFLKVRHKYEITFTFECTESLENEFDLQNSNVLANVRIVRLATVSTNGNTITHTVTAHLFAYKEKLLKEKVHLQSRNQQSQSLTFIFYGRVLGNGKGTPFLKQGIKCIGFELDDDEDENESSDNNNQPTP